MSYKIVNKPFKVLRIIEDPRDNVIPFKGELKVPTRKIPILAVSADMGFYPPPFDILKNEISNYGKEFPVNFKVKEIYVYGKEFPVNFTFLEILTGGGSGV